jgi:prepilin-type N-terminal cleavage/methylation domain-containing protein
MRVRGFTLIEMMIVVAIISVLAVIAGTAYRKYMDSGRVAEVYSMLGEIRTKQEVYKVENAGYASANASETDLFPALVATKGAEPKPHLLTSPPTWWTALGISPAKSSLYCSYTTVGGAANVAPTGTRGKAIFNNLTPTVAWWYAIGTCDNDSDGDSTHNAYFTTSSQASNVYNENEHW